MCAIITSMLTSHFISFAVLSTLDIEGQVLTLAAMTQPTISVYTVLHSFAEYERGSTLQIVDEILVASDVDNGSADGTSLQSLCVIAAER